MFPLSDVLRRLSDVLEWLPWGAMMGGMALSGSQAVCEYSWQCAGDTWSKTR